MISAQPQFGFSITSPFKAVAKVASSAGKAVGSGVATGVRATGSGIATGARVTGRAAVATGKVAGKGAIIAGKVAFAPALLTMKASQWLANQAMTPVKNKVHTLRDRRANKLAWDKRKSRTPNAAEKAEAKAWTQAKLKSQGPHGQVLALFAGPPMRMLNEYESAMQLGEVVTAATITASIPVFLAILNALLNKTSRSGEAPANIGPDGQPMPQQGPDAPGTVDMTPVQEAAQAMAEDAAAESGVEASGGGALMRVPGVGPVQRSHLMLGAAVVGGVLLLMMLTRKKS